MPNWIDRGKIHYQFKFDKVLIDLAKYIGMIWSPSRRLWYMPNNYLNRKLFRDHVDHTAFPEYPKNGNPVLFHEPSAFLMKHQKAAIKLAETTERHLYAYDTGTGKTLIGLELVKQKRVKTLVVCPLSIIEPAWFGDQKKFAPDLKIINLWKIWNRNNVDNVLHRLKYIDIAIINFESFKPIAKYLLKAKFGMIFIDESSKIKNPKSQITKMLTAFCDHFRYVYLFSGTPAPNTNLEYYQQARVVDPTLFGKNYYRFRNKYFYSTGYGKYTWLPQRSEQPELLSKIANFTSVARKEDVLDLPERTDNIRSVQLSAKEKTAYKDMVTHLLVEIDNEEITAYNAGVKGMKLRQITSGFLYGEEKKVYDFGKSKLNELKALLEEIGDKQILIWSQFIYEASCILNLKLSDGTRLGDQAGAISGLTPKQEDRDKYIKQFISGELKYLVAHPKSLAHGVTLVNCSYATYFSLSYSHEDHYQSRDRIYRKGQKNACSYYYLIVPNSIDRVILNALNRKNKTAEAVFNHIKSLREWEAL